MLRCCWFSWKFSFARARDCS